MKAFLFGILFLILAGVGGFFYLSSRSSNKPSTQAEQVILTRTGMLVKTPSTNSDVTHSIRSDSGESWGVTSYAVNLDDYVGKKVEAKGQNSGTTLYIDTITVLP